jgi:hypothetical protein
VLSLCACSETEAALKVLEAIDLNNTLTVTAELAAHIKVMWADPCFKVLLRKRFAYV